MTTMTTTTTTTTARDEQGVVGVADSSSSVSSSPSPSPSPSRSPRRTKKGKAKSASGTKKRPGGSLPPPPVKDEEETITFPSDTHSSSKASGGSGSNSNSNNADIDDESNLGNKFANSTNTSGGTVKDVTELDDAAESAVTSLCKNWFGQPVFSPATDAVDLNGPLEGLSKRVARSPCLFLWTSMLVGTALSAVGLIVGEFAVSAETGGWNTRGTLISNRHTQLLLATEYQEYLFYGGVAAWDDLETNVQPGWESGDDDDSLQEDDTDGSRRRLGRSSLDTPPVPAVGGDPRRGPVRFPARSAVDYFKPKTGTMGNSPLLLSQSSSSSKRPAPFVLTPDLKRRLQEAAADSNSTSSSSFGIAGCDTSFYEAGNLTEDSRLWPVWKTAEGASEDSNSVLDPKILRDICVAEQHTQTELEAKGLCFGGGCPDNRCLPPYSVVFYARLIVPDGFDLDCDTLADAWTPFQEETEVSWKECVKAVKESYDVNNPDNLPAICPLGFFPSAVQGDFDESMVSSYSSTIFATRQSDVKELYAAVTSFDRGTEAVTGAYDTQYEQFVNYYSDESLGRDMALALGSAIVVCLAIMIHTRSLLITGVGLLQVVLSFPLAYFVYNLIAGLEFFPFLNFIGIFVVFALGAGDIFVAIDNWKNTRLQYPTHSTEFIAAKSIPDAAWAMFLTTLTTAVAFFSTAICPVAPIKMFAIFCGLLIIFDYIMCVLMVFPALCIYDKSIQAKKRGHVGNRFWTCCVSCTCFGFCTPKIEMDDLEEAIEGHGVTASRFIRTKSGDAENDREEEEMDDSATSKATNIQRAMLGFYYYLHVCRWPLFVVSAAALGVCIWKASTLSLPQSSDVRLLSSDVQFEQNWAWRQELLLSQLDKLGGSQAAVIWGVTPADTGDQNNPASWSQLVLDQSFKPSSEVAQSYLLKFCDDLLAQDFASPVDSTFVCPMTRFDDWLAEQSTSSSPDEGYTEFCSGATGVPVPEDNFDACISSWAALVAETSILSKNGVVTIMLIPFTSRVRFDFPFEDMDDEWHLIEDWINQENEEAPDGVQNVYFSSADFWWYDTNGSMLATAYSSAAITLGASAVVILFSSRSLVLTLFATITIGYILTSVTAMLVAFGWTLGFLESICFAILIGVSVDFVIHFSHAYAHKKGEVSRGDRTKYAVVKMGPSLLATAVTTILSAVVMLFTIISFFQKFALILFLTVLQATLGSFIVFLTMTDCIGPEHPTYLVDKCFAMRCKWFATICKKKKPMDDERGTNDG